MNIWLINHYAVPIQYYPLARTTNFAKYLMRMGHTVTIFAASSVHNSTINLIEDGRLYREEIVEGIHYVYIRCRSYTGNGIGRISNMFEFAFRLESVCKHYSKPDAVVATSATPPACMEGLRLAKKYGVKAVAEVTDLWPESFVAYGFLRKYNPILIPMYLFEKRMYEYADKIIFSMGGGYDYIRERGWDQDIPEEKVYYINNGIDLKTFNYNKENYQIEDVDLVDEKVFKVVYTGSLLRGYSLEKLLDAAKIIDSPSLSFLIWGKGDRLQYLQEYVVNRDIKNVIFKGYVDKKYIPFILSKCNLAVLNVSPTDILRYGGSQNKLFDYLASGVPIISGEDNKYSIIRNERCGISKKFNSPAELAEAILAIKEKNIERDHIKNVAKQYDFEILTEKLLDIIK